jgi:diguanylate cyclase (GGDEF)-like protein
VYGRVALRDQVLLRLTRAQLWIAQGRPEALAEAEACVAGARELGDRILERQALDFLAELQLARGDAESAYISRKAWQALDKSMAMDVSARRISVLEAQAQRERDLAQQAMLERDLKEQSLTVYRQRLIGLALFGGFLIAAMVIYGLYWRYRESRQRNAVITASRDELANLHQALQRSAEDLERVARQDPLTGLNNRRAMVEYLHAAHADMLAGRTGLGVGIVDVDHFKRINDQNGHLVGDEVLKEIGRRLVEATGTDARVGRWGGEEFLLLWPGKALSECVSAAEQLRQVLAASPVVADDASVAVTASFGIAAVDAGGALTLNDLLASADRALYAAKAAGRNRVEHEG